MDGFFVTCIAVTGLCVAGAAWAGREAAGQALDFVEEDLRDRLRSLRILTPHLRRWIKIWLGVVLAVVAILWVGFDLPVFSVLAAALLSAGPWYLVRRLSTQRRQKIEDQLADAMVMFSNGVRAGLSLPRGRRPAAPTPPAP